MGKTKTKKQKTYFNDAEPYTDPRTQAHSTTTQQHAKPWMETRSAGRDHSKKIESRTKSQDNATTSFTESQDNATTSFTESQW